MTHLNIDGNPLISSLERYWSRKPVSELRMFLSSSRSTVEKQARRVKLMVVGKEAVGKTSLVRCFAQASLLKSPERQGRRRMATVQLLSTDGIDFTSIEIPRDDSVEHTIQFDVWDFAGQEVYYTTHEFFLSGNAIYVVAFDLSKQGELQSLPFWVESITSRAGESPILVVATHADLVESAGEQLERLRKVEALFPSHDFPTIKAIYPVSCKTKMGISDLMQELYNLAAIVLPPLSDLALTIDHLRQDKRNECLAAAKPPVTDPESFYPFCATSVVERDRSYQMFLNVLRVLHDLGTVYLFEPERLSPASNLSFKVNVSYT